MIDPDGIRRELKPDALQPRSSNIKVSRLSCRNCVVCFGDLFGGKFWPFVMVIVKAFDQTI